MPAVPLQALTTIGTSSTISCRTCTCVQLVKKNHTTSLPSLPTPQQPHKSCLGRPCCSSWMLARRARADSEGDEFPLSWMDCRLYRIEYRIVSASLWCCSRRQSEYRAIPPCCVKLVPCLKAEVPSKHTAEIKKHQRHRIHKRGLCSHRLLSQA